MTNSWFQEFKKARSFNYNSATKKKILKSEIRENLNTQKLPYLQYYNVSAGLSSI